MVVEGTTKRLILLGFPLMILVLIIGKEMFMVVFGASWAEAGVYSQILSFWIMVSFVTSPLSSLFSVLKKLRLMLFLSIAIFIIRSGALIVGGMYDDVYLSLILFSGTGGIIYILVGRWILIESGVSLSNLFKSMLKNVVVGSILLGTIFITKNLFSLDPIIITILGIIGILPYYMVLIGRDDEIKSIFFNKFHGSD